MSLVVCDASAVVEYLLQTDTGLAVAEVVEAANADIHVPALCDVEVASALRRMLRDQSSGLAETRADQAVADLLDLPFTRHTHEAFLERAFSLCAGPLLKGLLPVL